MNQTSRSLFNLFLLVFPGLVSAADRTIHFLPPPVAEWSAGGLELVFSDNSKASLQVDPDHCGWWLYKIHTSSANAIIQVQASDTVLQIGLHGPSFEAPQRIPFDSLFSAIPNSGHLYFSMDSYPASWSATYPNLARNCTFSMASIVYDSDHSLNSSFYAPLADRSNLSCVGVTKGMVLPKLPNNKRPAYNPSSGCFKNDSSFQVLFKETPGMSHKLCSDIPLKKNNLGYKEFDSRITPNEFFPVSEFGNSYASHVRSEAYSPALLGTGQGSHQLNNLNTTAISSGLFPEGVNWGASSQAFPNSPVFQYPVEQGEFSDSLHPNLYDINSWASRKKSMQNLDYCMESHTGFVARPGQAIYYYGDDDFWLFIDSSLVLDLGGLHFPAPGAVLLDTIPNLKPGTEHLLHIFQCNRLSQMPTFVFRTNIVFPEISRASLYYERDPITGAFVIKAFSDETQGCDATLGEPKYLGLRPFGIRYTLINANGDTLDADPAMAGRQIRLPENKQVWGGIRVHQDSVFLDSTKLSLPTGRYRIWVETLAPNGRLSITFRIDDPLSIRARKGNQPLHGNAKRKYYTLDGKRVPAH